MSFSVQGADYLVDQWTTEHGLPQSTILCITQTSDSYLWLATFNGLVRFDGVQFTVFNPVNTPVLRSARILVARVDRNRWLWIFSEEGHLTRMVDGKFEAANGRWGLPDGLVVPKGFDPDGNVWLRHVNLGSYFRFQEGAFVPAAVSESLHPSEFDRLVGGQENAWLPQGTNWSLADADNIRRHLTTLGLKSASAFGPSAAGGAWFLGDNELRRNHPKLSRVFPPGQLPAEATALAEDTLGNVWLATWREGLFMTHPSLPPERIPLTASGLVERLRTLFVDNEGNVWVGSDVAGLYRIKPRTFRNFDRANGLGGEVVKSVMEDLQGNVWVAHQEGIDSIRPDGNVTNHHRGKNLWSIARNAGGEVWFGSYSGAVWRHHDLAIDPVQIEAAQSSRPVRVLTPDSRGGLWLGMVNGLWQSQGAGMKQVPLSPDLPATDVRAIVEDAKGGVYVGTYGAGLLHREAGRWSRFGKAQGLADEHVLCLHMDTDGAVWIGTVCGGLSRFKDGRFVNYLALEPAIPELVSCILADDLGGLWLGGVDGIHRVARQGLNALADGEKSPPFVHHYGKGDGLGTMECAYGMQPTAWKGRDGRLWFATINGVAMVDPGKLPFNPRPPPVVIDEVLVDDRPVRGPWLSSLAVRTNTAPAGPAASQPQHSEALVLPPGNHRLEIRYTGLCLTGPQKMRFAFRLEGLYSEWTHAGSRRTAYFQGLGPGTYEFRVIACNNDGVWNKVGAGLPVVIEPFLWQTAWFRILVGAVLVAGVAAFVRTVSLRRVRNEVERLERQNAVNQERARIARDMHDDLGASLTQIRFLSEMAGRDGNDRARITQDLRDLSGLAQEAVRNLDELVWVINPDHDQTASFIDYLGAYAEEFLRPSGIACRFDFPADGLRLNVDSNTRHQFFLAFKEVLNNVLKHAAATEVTIRARLENRVLHVRVIDNGRGFDVTAKAGFSNGLINLGKRLSALGGRCDFRSVPGQGSQVDFELPVGGHDTTPIGG